MVSLFNAWRKVLSEHKPRRIRGAVWYRAVVPSRKRTILALDGALIYGGRYNNLVIFVDRLSTSSRVLLEEVK